MVCDKCKPAYEELEKEVKASDELWKHFANSGVRDGIDNMNAEITRLKAELEQANKFTIEIAKTCESLEKRCFGDLSGPSVFDQNEKLRTQLTVARECLEWYANHSNGPCRATVALEKLGEK